MAIAKTIGSLAIPNNISEVRIFPAESPKNTSAFTNACCKVVPEAPLLYLLCNSDKSVLSLLTTPLTSNITMFSTFTPSKTYRFAQAKAAEPAPETTNFILPISFSANSNAFNNAAEDIIAVPC